LEGITHLFYSKKWNNILLLSFVKLKPDDKEFYKALKKTLGFSPKNLLIYKRALTHKSAQKINVFGVSINNERLEFLGDSVIDTVIADYLFNRYPNENEGFLTNLRSKIVKRTHLDKLGKDLNLDILINSQSGNKFRNNHILGNALEALVGAIYLDLGFKYAKKFIIYTLIRKYIDVQSLADTEENFKSKKIEYVQQKKLKLEYITKAIDTGNKRTTKFQSTVTINGEIKGSGTGFSKKEAEQKASEEALKNI